MRIFLVEEDKIFKYELPSKIEDSFVVNHKTSKGKDCILSFEADQGKWKIKSNGSVDVVNNSTFSDEASLIDYGSYDLKVVSSQENIVLYALPTVEVETYKLEFKGLKQLLIGKENNCNICYHNNNIAPSHALITYEGQNWFINANDATYLNGNRVTKAVLHAGDTIFIKGLKIVWMQHFIQINNPNKLVTVAGLNAYTYQPAQTNQEYTPVSDEQQSMDLYDDDDYFFHTPRIREVVEEEEVEIDAPPASEKEEDTPFWLTIGSSITMGASSLVMGYNVGYGLMTGTRTIMSALPQIVLCIAMIVGSLIIPKMASAYHKKKRAEREELRIRKYNDYLDEKEEKIIMIMKKQAQIMRDNSLTANGCVNVINSVNNRNFWGRNISDDDFLKLRLGLGSVNTPLHIVAPKEKFTLDDDDLLKRVYTIVDRHKKLVDVPINISLIDKKISAFICSANRKNDYINGLMVQLLALHSGGDLKIVILTNEKNQSRWNYLKYSPYCFNDDKSLRFFATNAEEIKEVSSFLESEFKTRKDLLENKVKDKSEAEDIKKADEYKNFLPYYLIVCDDYKSSDEAPIISNILKYADTNYGFSIAIFSSTMKNLPAKCESFIEIGDNEGCILESNINSSNQIVFKTEYLDNADMEYLCQKVNNIPLLSKEGISVLPNSISFLEMLNVSKIEQLNVLNRWQTNNPVNSLNTTIGVHASGEQFKLNLHEKFHGPHGLIAGSTGSGKSEFIITYILSMCVNYHPYEVQFVLIDYKGGGLAGAFENKELDVRIPHLAGTITNLDTASMNRTLVSIESELKRRQRIFNETRDVLGESTIDIYKYQRLYREGQVKEPMAHLFIISDEFAELKSQQPEFMQQLIQTARIGRSLGVHLILATQKPSGVVNDQIWSNSKFKVCLKVQDRADSMEMLKRPEAASIKETGRFYLQVGYDDYFAKGQSGWAGAKYVPSDRVIKKIDDSIDFIDNVGNVTKSIKDLIKIETDNTNYGDQLTNIVKYIYNLGKKENLKTSTLWLDPIPEEIFVDDIKKKYHYKPTPYHINPVIGEYDNPSQQEQGILTLDLMNGNAIIWGQPGAGKENLVQTILWSASLEHTPDEINFYVIDCGSEALKTFNKMPHIGEIATTEEQDKILGILMMIDEEIERRKELMADYGGSYKEYIENSGNKLPLIVTIINNYEIFSENYARVAESIQTFYRDGNKYGISFIITSISTSTVKLRMLQNFSHKLCLQIPNETEYRNLVSAIKGQLPTKYFGRGLVAKDSKAYEFQTALITTKKEINNLVRDTAKKLSQAYNVRAKKIPMVPEVVYFSSVKDNLNDLTNVPIGYAVESKTPYAYDLTASKFIPILFNKFDDNKFSFLSTFIKMVSLIDNLKINVIDFAAILSKRIDNVNYIQNNYDSEIIKLNNDIIKAKDKEVRTLNIFIGISEMKVKLSANGRVVLNSLFNNSSVINNSYYVFFDSYSAYKILQTEPWYQTNIDTAYGIWLDEGVATQLAINTSTITAEDGKTNFPYMGFAISRGKHTTIRYMVEDVEEGNDEK